MRSVPGSHFLFDWCIAAGYRDIPFSSYYPGNNVVNIIGIDIYDAGMPGDPQNAKARWHSLDLEPSGLSQILAFAHENNKPLSIPEWGLVTKKDGGLGDDPTYVEGIANTIQDNPVVYESYFNKAVGGTMPLGDAERSLQVWRKYFGDRGIVAERPWLDLRGIRFQYTNAN
jgi:hypothetical protein